MSGFFFFFFFFLSFIDLFFTFWLCLEARGILVPRPGIEPVPLQWKHRVPTTGPSGKSCTYLFFFLNPSMCYVHRLKYMKEIKPNFYQWLPIMKMIWMSVKGTLTFCSMGPTFLHCVNCVTKLFTTGTNLFRVSGI